VARFSRTDQAIAYGGLDVEIKESGHRIGKAKLSKRGAGCLDGSSRLSALHSIHTEGSPFGADSRRLVERGFKKGSALMAVMRKMLAVAVHLLKHEQEDYDRSPSVRAVLSFCQGAQPTGGLCKGDMVCLQASVDLRFPSEGA